MSSTANKGLDFDRAPFVSLLLILGALSGGLIGIVGLLLANAWSGRSAPLWETTHYLYPMRGFWIGLLADAAGAILVWAGLWTIGGLVLTSVALWSLVRAILSFANTLRREPMPEPLTYLFSAKTARRLPCFTLRVVTGAKRFAPEEPVSVVLGMDFSLNDGGRVTGIRIQA